MASGGDLAPMRLWTAGPVPEAVSAALARLRATPDVVRIAVMPDVHLSGDVCIGTVVATTRLILPGAVGGDLGCGMAALAFEASAHRLARASTAERMFRALDRAVPILGLEGARVGDLPEALDPEALSDPALGRQALREGRRQLGTLGRGNHFLEFQRDGEDRLWLMVHSGSRAMGQAIATHHLARARMKVNGFRCLPADEAEGRAYLDDVRWALAYADLNRRSILEAATGTVRDVLGADPIPDSLLTCHHNHVQAEMHFGRQVWVHRKGAIPADEGLAGIIPGSMGSPSFHVEGRGEPEALRSSSHGAGRAMDRTQARHRVRERDLHRQLQGIWFDPRRAGGLRDEAPSAYKDIQQVMRAQSDLTRTVRRLDPVLCYKGT